MSSIRSMCVSATVKLMPVITTVTSMSVAMTYGSMTAYASDATSDDYAKNFMSEHGMKSDANKTLGSMGLKTYSGEGDVLPNFEQIAQGISNYLLAVIPVMFVIKFAGRAMLSLTHSGSGTLDIPNFFKAADERAQGPNGGAKDGTSWYVMMGKDFIRYFGVAVGVWAIFNAILMVINFVFNMDSAPTSTSEGFLSQFNDPQGK